MELTLDSGQVLFTLYTYPKLFTVPPQHGTILFCRMITFSTTIFAYLWLYNIRVWFIIAEASWETLCRHQLRVKRSAISWHIAGKALIQLLGEADPIIPPHCSGKSLSALFGLGSSRVGTSCVSVAAQFPARWQHLCAILFFLVCALRRHDLHFYSLQVTCMDQNVAARERT